MASAGGPSSEYLTDAEAQQGSATPYRIKAGIVFAIDDGYLEALPAFAASLAYHNPTLSLPIACLVPAKISTAALRRVRAVFAAVSLEVNIVPVYYSTEGLPTYAYITATGHFRLLIPDLLPELDRALYLDVDTLVLTPIEPLVSTDLQGTAVAAVRDPLNPCLGWPLALYGPPLPEERARQPYFNAGVMVIDLNLWRARALGRAAMELIVRHDERLHFIEQDALNLVLDGDFLQLPRAWNTYASTSGSRAEREAKILHFIGALKPWAASYPHTTSGQRYRKYQRSLQLLLESHSAGSGVEHHDCGRAQT